MLMRPRITRRTGALAVEAAFVHPLMLFIMLAMIVGGTGVFRYQQVACQAREAARWAAVHGSDWEKNTDQPSPTQDDIRKQAVAPLTAGMDPTSLSVKVEWLNQATGAATDWDKAARKDPQSLTKTGDYLTNSVRVTVTYQFSPKIFFLGSMQLQSTCEHPMTF